MNLYKQVIHSMKQHLLMTVPAELLPRFRAQRFTANMSRFLALSANVVILDLISLSLYLAFDPAQGRSGVHIAAYCVKIALMIGVFLFSFSLHQQTFRSESFLHRHYDFIFCILYFLLEYTLFFTGPMDIGALCRLFAISFIATSAPVLRQEKALALLVIMYIANTIAIPLIPEYADSVNRYIHSFMFNIWLIVFYCSMALSFAAYSWYVAAFLAVEEERVAQSELSSMVEQLKYMSDHDVLTGLLNRRGFQLLMENVWESPKKSHTSLTIMMIDIDHFKRYNDRFGHIVGDECLQKVTGAVASVLAGDHCWLARYGGEEVIAVAYDRNHEEMIEYAEQMRKKVISLRLANPDSDASAYVTVSIGIATQNVADIENYGLLIDWADECLYFAKHYGRNRIIQTYQKRGEFTDIHGVNLVIGQNHVPYSRQFDVENTQRVLRDIGANCSYIYDEASRRLMFSTQAVELFGMPQNIVVDNALDAAGQIGVAKADIPNFIYVVNKCLANHESVFTMELSIMRLHGPLQPVSITGQCSYSNDGNLGLIYGSIISLKKMNEYNNFLLYQSMTSSVTLLPNRERLSAEMRKLLAEGGCGYTIFLNIQDFKNVNSYFSHTIGDRVLRDVARHLSRVAINQGVYSYDADQFAIIAPEVDRAAVEQLMNELDDNFSPDLLLAGNADYKLEFYIVAVEYDGVAMKGTRILDDVETAVLVSGAVDQLFLDLDAAMQLAKYEKGSRHIVFDGKDKEGAIAKISLNHSLRESIDKGFAGFELYYQPIVNASTDVCVGAEALLRWRDKEGEIVPPSLVIPMLEQIGLMGAAEKWILDTACKQCAQWIKEGAGESFFMNINLSSAAINRSMLYQEIVDAIYDNGLTLNNVTLEVTESSSMVGRKSAIHTLERLRKQGVRIAIDDFGTGYSSLSYLGSLPANEIKIDRSFVTDVDSSISARNFLASIVSMAKSMGFLVCIEGVESDGQADVLEKGSIDFLQGFLYGHPVAAASFYKDFISGNAAAPSGDVAN